MDLKMLLGQIMNVYPNFTYNFREIFGEGPIDVKNPDIQYLIDEYRRLGELPSLSLSNDYSQYYWDNQTGRYDFLSNARSGEVSWNSRMKMYERI